MPQPREKLKADRMYHVWTHANGDENLFREKENYTYFLEKYIEHVHPVAGTFAYCLMPNHFHLMIHVKQEDVVLEYLREKKEDPNLQGFGNLGGFSYFISQQFSNLFNSYTKSINNRYDRMGSLFKPNFKRKLIDSREYFGHLIAYIHKNPVQHGFVENIQNWPFSSWHAYLTENETKINKETGFKYFGGREAFITTHRQLKPEKLIPVFEEQH